MAYERSIHRYRSWYGTLLRLHEPTFYARYGEGMEQTFNDLLCERKDSRGRLLTVTAWVFVETLAAIIREKTHSLMNMSRTLKFILAALCVLIVPLGAEMLQNTGAMALDGFDWKVGDFVLMAILLAGFGAAIAYATGPRTTAQRVVGGVVVLCIVALYVHLAVGIVDTWPLAGS